MSERFNPSKLKSGDEIETYNIIKDEWEKCRYVDPLIDSIVMVRFPSGEVKIKNYAKVRIVPKKVTWYRRLYRSSTGFLGYYIGENINDSSLNLGWQSVNWLGPIEPFEVEE